MSKNGDHDGDLLGMKVLLADQDEGALRIAAALVRDLGHEVTELAVGVQEAAEVIARDDPDLSIVVVDEDDELRARPDRGDHRVRARSGHRDGGERGPGVRQRGRQARDLRATRARGWPTRSSRRSRSRCAATPSKRELAEQVERLETALERRALIERAKGILMERHDIGEREAFDRLRGHARSRNRTVVDVSASVAEGHALLPKARD